MRSGGRVKCTAGRYDDVELEWRDDAFRLTRLDRPTRRLLLLTADGRFAVQGVDTPRAVFASGRLQLWRTDDPQPRTYAKSTVLALPRSRP